MTVVRRLALLVPLALAASMLAPVAGAGATTTTYPTLTVTGPSRGNPVNGVDGVFATGSVDPAGSDAPQTLALYFNGTLSDTRQCAVPAGTKTCTLSLLFDASAHDGPQTVRVDFTTAQGHTVSSSQTITAYTPPPVASMSSPADHSSFTTGDQVDVDTAGFSAQSVNDPRTMDLLVDGVSVEQDHCPFPGDGMNCPDDFTWDTSAVSPGAHTLQAKMTTYHDYVALSPLVHVTVSAPAAPIVVLNAPTAATGTVTDLAFVSATGTVTAAGDSPYGMVLVVDGSTFGSTELCPPPILATCSLNLIWDTTGLSGPHTVAVEFLTTDTQVTSKAVTVSVVNPPPTVAITSPLANASVSGVTPVTATGTLDDRQSDSVKDLQLVVDGTATGPLIGCGVASRTSCTQTLSWDTAGLSGPHQLQVRFDTRLTSATSAATTVTVGAVQTQPVPTTITLKPSGAVTRGGRGVVRGTLSNSATHVGVAAASVHVVFTPLHGAVRSLDVTTAADGTFVATDPDRLQIVTAVLATTGADLGSSSATSILTVRVRITCVVPKRLQHGHPATIVCTAPGLSFGSVITLHYAQDGHGAVFSKVAGGAARFSLTVAGKGWVKLWATTATTRSFVASQSAPRWVNVR